MQPNTTYRKGHIIGAHYLLEKLPSAAFRVQSWQNGTAPKTKEEFYAMCKVWGIASESVFDAAHGKRYMLFVYKSKEERKACWDCVTAPQ